MSDAYSREFYSNFDSYEFQKQLEIAAMATPYFATNRDAVNKVFEPLFKLSDTYREVIGHQLEQKFCDFEKWHVLVETEGLAAAEKKVNKLSRGNPSIVENEKQLQVLVLIRPNIGKLLGDKALRATKAFNEAAIALTPEEIESRAVYAKPMLAAVRAIDKEQKAFGEYLDNLNKNP